MVSDDLPAAQVRVEAVGCCVPLGNSVAVPFADGADTDTRATSTEPGSAGMPPTLDAARSTVAPAPTGEAFVIRTGDGRGVKAPVSGR